MFDQLHDPDPPAASSHHLAVVAERAAHLRRRRSAAAGGLAAVALLAAGTVGLAAADRSSGQPEPLAEGQTLPAIDVADTTADAPAPTTTVLDPESLPPAIPVNPDPDDLPPAVPVITDPDDGNGDDVPSGGRNGDDDGGPGDQTADGDASNTSGTDDDPGPTLDVGTAAALRSADPLAAITITDAAVWFPSLDDEPMVIDFGHGVERLDFLDDGTATIERSGSTVISTQRSDGTPGDGFDVGVRHAVGPDGTTVCGIDAGATTITCTDGDDTVSFNDAFGAGTGSDLTWLDADTVLAIGRGDAWTITIAELAIGEATTRPFALLGDFDDLRFAGRDAAGGIAVHDAGTRTVLVGSTLDRFGGDWNDDGSTGSSLEVRELDEPARSFWYDGSTEIVVATDGTLTVDGNVIPGSYRSARR